MPIHIANIEVRSLSMIKVIGQSSRRQKENEISTTSEVADRGWHELENAGRKFSSRTVNTVCYNVVKVIGATSSKGFIMFLSSYEVRTSGRTDKMQ